MYCHFEMFWIEARPRVAPGAYKKLPDMICTGISLRTSPTPCPPHTKRTFH